MYPTEMCLLTQNNEYVPNLPSVLGVVLLLKFFGYLFLIIVHHVILILPWSTTNRATLFFLKTYSHC